MSEAVPKRKIAPWLHFGAAFAFAGLLLYTNPLAIGDWRFARILLVLLILLLLWRGFYLAWVKAPRWKGSGPALVLFALLTLGGIGEGVFMFVPHSVGAASAFCAQLWYKKYWKPVKSGGFRDSQSWSKKPGSRKVLVFLGDSFAAGQGIEDANLRFPDLVRERVKPDWWVYNLGDPGADTQRELENLERFPHRPNLVILQWFVNDIESAARKNGLEYVPELPLMGIPGLNLLIRRSYLCNFLYVHYPFRSDFGYGEFLEQAYGNEEILKTHAEELQLLKRKVEWHGSQMIILPVFSLRGGERNLEYQQKMSAVFQDLGVYIISTDQALQEIPAEERIVNPWDDHPSEKSHRVLADLILNFLGE